MGKKLNDWLDEFVENGADPKAVQEWPDNVSGGGVELVDTLPTTGNVNKLYKLPNGDIYSYYRNITTERVPVYEDMEVGGTYSLKGRVEFKYLSKICQPELENHEVKLHFVPEGQYGSCIELRYEAMEATLYRATFYPHIFNGVAEDDDPPYAKFSALGEEVTEDSIIQVYAFDLQDAPSFTINEQFVSELENQGLNLSDFEAFFNLGIDHYEEVEHINKGWKKVNNEMSFDELIVWTPWNPLDQEFKYINITLNNEPIEFKLKSSVDYLLNVVPKDIWNSMEEYWDDFKGQVYTMLENNSLGYVIEGLHNGDVLHFEIAVNDSPSGLVGQVELNGETIAFGSTFNFDVTVTKNSRMSFFVNR